MKAISLKPLWAHLILCGEKTVEFRTWKTTHRGSLLICSSATPREPNTIVGQALCLVTLKDVVPFETKHLDAAHLENMPDKKGYAWILEDVRYIKPFPVKGKLHLYDVSDDLIHPVAENSSEAEYIDFFKTWYLPKMEGGPISLYEAFLCPITPGADWQDTEELNTLIQGVMPLPMPERAFRKTAKAVLHDEITNGVGVWCYRGTPAELKAFLAGQGMLTKKFASFCDAYPDCAVAFQDNFFGGI